MARPSSKGVTSAIWPWPCPPTCLVGCSRRTRRRRCSTALVAFRPPRARAPDFTSHSFVVCRHAQGVWIGAHTRALAAIGGVPRLIARTTPRSPSSRRACTSRRSTEPMPRWRRIGAFCRPQLSFTGGCLARTTNAPSTAFWMFETNSLLRDTTASTSPLDVLKTSTYSRRGQIS
jgi:hypothetical protein